MFAHTLPLGMSQVALGLWRKSGFPGDWLRHAFRKPTADTLVRGGNFIPLMALYEAVWERVYELKENGDVIRLYLTGPDEWVWISEDEESAEKVIR